MTEYFVTFFTKLSAKNEKDLERKAEQTAEAMSKCLHKTVQSHGYVEILKKDRPIDSSRQEKLI